MKKIILSLLSFMISVSVFSQSLKFNGAYTSISYKLDVVSYSIEYINLGFNNKRYEEIVLSDENLKAEMLDTDGNILAFTDIVTTYINDYSEVYVLFDKLVLPKGKYYYFHIAKDALYVKGDPSVTNEEISVKFFVPECVNMHMPITGAYASEMKEIYFEGDEVKAKADPLEIYLYREDKLVKKIPAETYWDDWYIGSVRAEFDETIYFENGVRYAFEIPEDAICAIGRDDITNHKTTFYFTGTYKGDIPESQKVWQYGEDLTEINEVTENSTSDAITLFTIDGKTVKRNVIDSSMPQKGIFIVKQGNKTRKIVK